MDLSWMSEGNCAGTPADDVFFPERENKRTSNRAREAYCEGCPVREPCLKYSVVTDQKGVWGGTTERQRHSLPDVVVLMFRQELSYFEDQEETLVVHTEVVMLLEEVEELPEEPPEELFLPIALPLIYLDATESQFRQAI